MKGECRVVTRSLCVDEKNLKDLKSILCACYQKNKRQGTEPTGALMRPPIGDECRYGVFTSAIIDRLFVEHLALIRCETTEVVQTDAFENRPTRQSSVVIGQFPFEHAAHEVFHPCGDANVELFVDERRMIRDHVESDERMVRAAAADLDHLPVGRSERCARWLVHRQDLPWFDTQTEEPCFAVVDGTVFLRHKNPFAGVFVDQWIIEN